MKSIRLLPAALAAALLVVTGTTQAQIRDQTLKFAFQNTKEHPQGRGAQKFAELVSQKSGGKMKVALFPSGSLGGDLPTVSALQGGTIDMTVLNAGLLVGVIRPFGMLDLPYLFNTPQEADAIVDGPVGKKLLALLPEKNLVGLAYWELGFRDVTNSKRPITRVEDIPGLKLRVVQTPLQLDVFSALGANPVPMPFPEVYTALEQKAVDGQENPVTVILDTKFAEVQKYLSLTHHTYNAQSVILAKKTWDRLSTDERKIVTDAATEATAYQRQVSREASAKAIDALKAAGMQVNELSPQEVARLRAKVKPVIDKFTPQFGEPLVQEMLAELAKLRGDK